MPSFYPENNTPAVQDPEQRILNKILGTLQSGLGLAVGDIEIGSVELKDASSDQRAAINASGQVGVVGPLTDTQLRASGVTVKGTTPRITGSVARPADNTAYAVGDIIANSGTAGDVAPIEFEMGGTSGRLTGCRATVLAASGTIVLPAFDLILFRPVTDIPFAAAGYPADNAALNISASAYNEVIAIYQFSATSWRNQAGGTTAAGDHVYQAVSLASRSIAPFNLLGLPVDNQILGLVQAQNAWTPTGVINTISFALDADIDS